MNGTQARGLFITFRKMDGDILRNPEILSRFCQNGSRHGLPASPLERHALKPAWHDAPVFRIQREPILPRPRSNSQLSATRDATYRRLPTAA